jgi:hypothetical protein
MGLGCSSSANSVDGGNSDLHNMSEVGTDADHPDDALTCPVVTAMNDAGGDQSPGPQTCGGEASVAGMTPFGTFVVRNVSSFVSSGDCDWLALTFDDGEDSTSGFTGIWLYVNLPYPVPYDPTKPLTGPYHVDGVLNALLSPTMSVTRRIPVTLEISAANPLFRADGGVLVAAVGDGGTAGHIAGTIDADTGCGHVTGMFTVPYCRELECVGPPP